LWNDFGGNEIFSTVDMGYSSGFEIIIFKSCFENSYF